MSLPKFEKMSFLKLKQGKTGVKRILKNPTCHKKSREGPLTRQAFANKSVYPSADIEPTSVCLVSAGDVNKLPTLFKGGSFACTLWSYETNETKPKNLFTIISDYNSG